MIAQRSWTTAWCLLVAWSTSDLRAGEFVEAADAGDGAVTAQAIVLPGPLEELSGRLEHAFDVDLYLLRIEEPTAFSVTPRDVPGAAPDLQLFLFNRWGEGLVAVDDWDAAGAAALPVGLLAQELPGEYLLGVAAARHEPWGLWGELFPPGVIGPRRPEGLAVISPLIGWQLDRDAIGGAYAWSLTGAAGLSPSASADFTGDGVVDAEDLAVWETQWGRSGPPPLLGDADGDGFVGGGDLLIWQRQFAPPPEDVPTWSVPEATSLRLAALVVSSAAVLRGAPVRHGPVRPRRRGAGG